MRLPPCHRCLLLLAVLVTLVGACNTTRMARKEQLGPTVEQYNRYIRWERAERAHGYVHPDETERFASWADETAERFDYQSFRVRKIEFSAPSTAIVDVERTGFEIPRYIEETTSVEQRWIYGEKTGWRIVDGF